MRCTELTGCGPNEYIALGRRGQRRIVLGRCGQMDRLLGGCGQMDEMC